MIVIGETTLVGTSELRDKASEITENLKRKKIIVTKKGNPVAVLQDFEEYQETEKLLETFEDVVLGYLAKERDEATTSKDYISEEKVMKKLNM